LLCLIRDYFEPTKNRPAKSLRISPATGPKSHLAYIHRVEVGLGDLNLYAEAFQQWQEATANIRENGAVCAHPRTGQPMPNPYLAVQTAALKNLQRFARLKTD
jgi:hypothetical protein